MGKNKGEATRENILKATLEVFGDVNFHQATTRQIAKKAGVSQAAIYKYFEILGNWYTTQKKETATVNQGTKV